MSSQISTLSTKPGRVLGLEQQVGTDRRALAGQCDLAAQRVARRNLAPFVEFAVRRQVGFRHYPQ